MSEAAGRAEMERRLLQRSLEDDAFRQRLLEDPKAAVEQELGTRLPEDVRVVAVEETAETIYLVLPFRSTEGQEVEELSDGELEAVAGGADTVMCTFTCPPPEGSTAPCNCSG
jgi:Nitrile hydratase, alpha chain